jgi:hypothetical protein
MSLNSFLLKAIIYLSSFLVPKHLICYANLSFISWVLPGKSIPFVSFCILFRSQAILPTIERARERPCGLILSLGVANSNVNLKKQGTSYNNKEYGLKLGYNLNKNL